MRQDILPLCMIIVVLFGNMTQVFAATFPVTNIPDANHVDLISTPPITQQNAAKIKKSYLKSPENKRFDAEKKAALANGVTVYRHTFNGRENRLDRNGLSPARISQNNPDGVEALLETVQDKIPLLDDEKMSQIEWVAKDLNSKAANLNVQIDQAFNKIRVDSFLMNALFPMDENAAAVGFSQGDRQRLLSNQAYVQGMHTTQLLLQSEEVEEPKGFVAFIFAIPRYLFDIGHIITLSLIFVLFWGIYKGLDFFLNKRW